MAQTILRAPFSGKVANLKISKHDQIGAGEEICAIINDQLMSVVFHLVDTEIHHINLQDKVSVVDENGMVEVKARIKNTGNLLDGMQVKVSVKKSVPEQLVVPKEAVVLRLNQEVLFRYTDGIAYWTYVQTGLENSQHYTVIAHPDKGANLDAGDTVIISNNLNLAHESKVKLR